MKLTLLLSLITIFSASLMDNLSDYENFLNTSILTDYHYEPLHFDPEAYIWENDTIWVYEYQINGDSIFNFRKAAVYYLPIEKKLWKCTRENGEYSIASFKRVKNSIFSAKLHSNQYVVSFKKVKSFSCAGELLHIRYYFFGKVLFINKS